MTATTAAHYSDVPRVTPRARPEGVDRAIMRLGLAMLKWARRRAERKAAAWGDLTDHERMQLLREATMLREATHAERARWHAIG